LGRVFEMDGLGDDLDKGPNKEDGSVYDENPPTGPQFLENRKLRTEVKRLRTELKNIQKKLNESLRANTTYKKVLNEVNLLNSKLMYNTKVLRKFELSEGQRERILNSFDRANSVREVELVYTTVCEAFNKKTTKTKMVEGSASKAVKQVKPNPNGHIVNESLVTRMQRLANIKKFED
jgi:predicted RNase H-like nuclease (RuvC/YqgF family)